MASGDLWDLRPINPVHQVAMDDILERFEREFNHLETAQASLEDVKELLTTVEAHVEHAQKFVKPFIAMVTLAVPIIITASVAYFAVHIDMGCMVKVVYNAFLMLMAVLTILGGVPTCINCFSDANSSFHRNSFCRCNHNCHRHFGFIDSDHSESRKLTVKNFLSTLAEIMKTCTVSLLLMISGILGFPVYFCDLCKTTKSSACHCYHGTTFMSSLLHQSETLENRDLDANLLFQNENEEPYVESESEREEESSSPDNSTDIIPELPAVSEDSNFDESTSKPPTSHIDVTSATVAIEEIVLDEDEPLSLEEPEESITDEQEHLPSNPSESQTGQSTSREPEKYMVDERKPSLLNETRLSSDEDLLDSDQMQQFTAAEWELFSNGLESVEREQGLPGLTPSLIHRRKKSFCLLLDMRSGYVDLLEPETSHVRS